MADQRQPPAPSAFLLPVNPAPVQASNNANSAQPERGFKMAIDAYLQIEGIKGEFADSAHPGWIEATGISWGVHQPRSATASTGGGHTAERAELSEISFSKLADISSPLLLQTCACGKTIPKARIELFRADGTGARVKYFEIELENVLIGMVKPHLGGADSYLQRRARCRI